MNNNDDHIMKTDTIFIVYLAVMVTVLGFIGTSL